MAITTKQQRQQRRSEALQLIADGVPPTDAVIDLRDRLRRELAARQLVS